MNHPETVNLLLGKQGRPFRVWHTKVSNRAILDSYSATVIPFCYGVLFMAWVLAIGILIQELIK